MKRFQLKKQLIDERELEDVLALYLRKNEYKTIRQERMIVGRTDLVVEIKQIKICIELKVYATLMAMEQLDRYLPKYPGGLVLMCWKASKNVEQVFKNVKAQINVPIELIQIYKNHGLG